MKKSTLLYFAVSCLIFIAGCKKDSQQPITSKSIEGKWVVTSYNYNYYNSSGAIVHTDSFSEGSIYTFANTDCVISGKSSSYTLIKSDGSDYNLSFGNPQLSDINMIKVQFADNSTMLWTAESTKPNELEYTDNGVSKVAAKVVLSIILKKQ